MITRLNRLGFSALELVVFAAGSRGSAVLASRPQVSSPSVAVRSEGIGPTRAAIELDGSGSASLMLGNEEYGDGELVVEGDEASIGGEDDGFPEQ